MAVIRSFAEDGSVVGVQRRFDDVLGAPSTPSVEDDAMIELARIVTEGNVVSESKSGLSDEPETKEKACASAVMAEKLFVEDRLDENGGAEGVSASISRWQDGSRVMVTNDASNAYAMPGVDTEMSGPLGDGSFDRCDVAIHLPLRGGALRAGMIHGKPALASFLGGDDMDKSGNGGVSGVEGGFDGDILGSGNGGIRELSFVAVCLLVFVCVACGLVLYYSHGLVLEADSSSADDSPAIIAADPRPMKIQSRYESDGDYGRSYPDFVSGDVVEDESNLVSTYEKPIAQIIVDGKRNTVEQSVQADPLSAGGARWSSEMRLPDESAGEALFPNVEALVKEQAGERNTQPISKEVMASYLRIVPRVKQRSGGRRRTGLGLSSDPSLLGIGSGGVSFDAKNTRVVPLLKGTLASKIKPPSRSESGVADPVSKSEYLVQVSSHSSGLDARRASVAARVQHKELDGLPLVIQEVPLGSSGVSLHRVRFVAGRYEEAIALCAKIRSAGSTCLVTR